MMFDSALHWSKKAWALVMPYLRVSVVFLLLLATGFWTCREVYRSHYAGQMTQAVHDGDMETVQELLDDGISPTWEDWHGHTGLEIAVQEDCQEAIHLFDQR